MQHSSNVPILYLLRGALFVAIGLVLLGALERVSRMYPEDEGRARRTARIENAWKNAESARILVLGSSHASRAIEAAALGRGAHVMGLAWNDIFEIEHQARALAGRMPNLEQAILVLSYNTFHWDNALGDESFLNSRRLFYAERPQAGWVPGDLRNFLEARTYWLVRSDHWYGVVSGLRGRQAEPREEEPRSTEFLAEHAEDRTARFITAMQEMTAQDSALTERTRAAAWRTIRLLQEQGVEVLLLTPPYHHTYNELFDPSGIADEMRMLVDRLAAEHDVPWIDTSRTFAGEDRWFNDSDHLNGTGRTAFTAWLARHPAVAASRPDRSVSARR
jgi:hypothetical protein